MANNDKGMIGVSTQLAEAVKRARAVRDAALAQSKELSQKRADEEETRAAQTNLQRRPGP